MESQHRRWRWCGVDGGDDRLDRLLFHLLIDDVEGELGNEEEFVVLAVVGTAVGAIVFLEPRIPQSCTEFALHSEVTADSPRAAIEETNGEEVALHAVVADILVQTERELHIPHIVVAVDEVGTPIAFMESGIGPPAQFGRNEQVSPFALFLVVGGPRAIASRETECPMGRHAHIHTQVGSARKVVDKVIAHGHIALCVGKAAKTQQQHHEHNPSPCYLKSLHIRIFHFTFIFHIDSSWLSSIFITVFVYTFIPPFSAPKTPYTFSFIPCR